MTSAILPAEYVGALSSDEENTPIPGAAWYTAYADGDGLRYRIPTGLLADCAYLSFDLYFDGTHMAKHTFHLRLCEEARGPVFVLTYALQPRCGARLRLPLKAVDQNELWLPREGALLKPSVRGERVNLAKVDSVEIIVRRLGGKGSPLSPMRWSQTPLRVTDEEPPEVAEPVLPHGALVDELGQSTIHDWAGKSVSVRAVTRSLRDQLSSASFCRRPEGFSRWGGWKERRVEATGFFRTHHDGTRWWLVDPDGHLFWSSGMNCVSLPPVSPVQFLEAAYSWLPDAAGEYAQAYASRKLPMEQRTAAPVNFLAVNFIRAFGKDAWYANWARIALGEVSRAGFNTVANWSDWKRAREAGLPFVYQLGFRFRQTPFIYRDFPDVHHPRFEAQAEEMARPLAETRDTRSLIGYFLQNEATWSFTEESPAAGMLFTTDTCYARAALAEHLRRKYATDEALSQAWGMEVTFDRVARSRWSEPLTGNAKRELESFSTSMVNRLYGTISRACRRADPNHLNLGTRFPGEPPGWSIAGIRDSVDVFSVNCYKRRLPDAYRAISDTLGMPVMIGEWHFGALDAGLPGLANQQVRTQADRGRAFRVYQESALADPCCVGSHYFRLYDNPALGRPDGENYNIGFLDICNQPYEPLVSAARQTHGRQYRVASGAERPYDDAPDYLGL